MMTSQGCFSILDRKGWNNKEKGLQEKRVSFLFIISFLARVILGYIFMDKVEIKFLLFPVEFQVSGD